MQHECWGRITGEAPDAEVSLHHETRGGGDTRGREASLHSQSGTGCAERIPGFDPAPTTNNVCRAQSPLFRRNCLPEPFGALD